MITYGTSLEDIKKATKEELIEALCTSDGCGVKKKKFILDLLIEDNSNSSSTRTLVDADEYFGKQLKVYP